MTDLDLLKLEIQTIWITDTRGRLLSNRDPDGPTPALVLASSTAGHHVGFDAEVPTALVDEISRLVADEPMRDPSTPPAFVDRYSELLGAPPTSGPSYWFAERAYPPSDARIVTSAMPVDAGVRAATDDLWEPWAAVLMDGEVVSYCHTARGTRDAAEAGTRTDPEHRGRGYAAAAAAAWSQMEPAPVLFYSTSADNRSSQRVAQRLGLRPIGWLWQWQPGLRG